MRRTNISILLYEYLEKEYNARTVELQREAIGRYYTWRRTGGPECIYNTPILNQPGKVERVTAGGELLGISQAKLEDYVVDKSGSQKSKELAKVAGDSNIASESEKTRGNGKAVTKKKASGNGKTVPDSKHPAVGNSKLSPELLVVDYIEQVETLFRL
jgi:hypothetical protein